jgi:hypothetical protein
VILTNLIFFGVLDHFDAVISKIIFKKIKQHYFDTFLSKKYFESNRNHTSKQALIQSAWWVEEVFLVFLIF